MSPKHPGKAIVCLTLAITLVLYLLSKRTLVSLGTNVFITLAQITALWGTVLFAFSFILASRTYLVEEAFGGLDRAYRVHHKIGVYSFSLLVAHLGTVIIGYGLNKAPLASLLTKNIGFITGEVGLVAMAAIILVIIFAKIKYQNFVIIQKFFAIPYAFGIYHLLIIPSDVSRYAPLRLFVASIAFLGLIAWFYREFFYRFLAPSATYVVKKVDEKGNGVTEITLTPKTTPLKTGIGQFAYFSFRSKTVLAEPHPFSFTSAPDSSDLSFAAKALGDFTATLKLAKVGDEVVVYGPYGKFFEDFDPNGENIFIAGGIGITPFLSALRGQIPCPKTINFYAVRTENDGVFSSELDGLATGSASFKQFFHDSERRGHLTADIVEKRSGGLEGKRIYLCGPAPMMQALTKSFLAKGVPKANIIFESFSY